MTASVTAWLTLTLALAAHTTFAVWSRRTTRMRLVSVLALLLAAPVAFVALRVPLGHPTYATPPAGRYVVLGAAIDIDVAIYVLLDFGEGEPRYYRLPYTVADANALQEAKDSQAGLGGGQIGLEIGEFGDATFHEPPVEADTPKAVERPIIGG